MSVLRVRDAYHRWAPTYDSETAVTTLENDLIGRIGAVPQARRVLDAGCGTGRRMREVNGRLVIGIDVTFNMLAHAKRRVRLAAADVRALPFQADLFDLVYCRLVLGHVAELSIAYAELARVCRAAGTVIVSDFHAAAADAGHRRTFRDAAGRLHEVEHYVHTPMAHASAAAAAGLRVIRVEDATVGPAVVHLYTAAGRHAQYEQQCGLPLVIALVCVRSA